MNHFYHSKPTPLLTLLFMLLGLTLSSQTEIKVEKPKLDISGIWTVTDYHNADSTTDTWEFKADGTFNELKAVNDLSVELVADESGSWELTDDTLTLIVIGERTKGEFKNYETPITRTLKVTQEGSDFALDILSESALIAPEGIVLRLTKR